ncbi:MAG: hypothetical protein R6X35_00345 [Candidatus Krumholzibacteriia bacterium]
MPDPPPAPPRAALALVFLVAVIARGPALQTTWCLDDWGLLAGAAGLAAGGPARWVSQHLYWDLTWPLLGLDAFAHAVLRLVLHGIAAGAVVAIGVRGGLPTRGAVLAGLLFAAGPVSFTPVFWAAGIQELLGTMLALLAVERWLAGGRRGLVAAAACGIGAIFSKEAALGLPLFFFLLIAAGRPPGGPFRRVAWGVAGLLLAAAVAEGLLVLGHFARSEADPYAVGGLRSVAGNLAKFGWWLASPLPVFTSRITWTVIGGGAALWLAWAAAAALRWRRGDRLPAAALAGAVLSLAAALPLVGQTHPYLGTTAAAAGALTLGALVPRRGRLHPAVALVAAAAAAAWGWLGMEARIANRNDRGWPADPVVRAQVLARQAATVIRDAAAGRPRAIVILQPPVTVEQARRSAQDPTAVTESARWSALAGDLGPRLLAGPQVPVRWTTSLADLAEGEHVLCESAKELRDWGAPETALFYATILDLGLGHDARAVAHLQRAAELGADPTLFVYDDALSGARTLARRRLRPFTAFLAAETAHGRLTPTTAKALRTTTTLLLTD